MEYDKNPQPQKCDTPREPFQCFEKHREPSWGVVKSIVSKLQKTKATSTFLRCLQTQHSEALLMKHLLMRQIDVRLESETGMRARGRWAGFFEKIARPRAFRTRAGSEVRRSSLVAPKMARSLVAPNMDFRQRPLVPTHPGPDRHTPPRHTPPHPTTQ